VTYPVESAAGSSSRGGYGPSLRFDATGHALASWIGTGVAPVSVARFRLPRP